MNSSLSQCQVNPKTQQVWIVYRARGIFEKTMKWRPSSTYVNNPNIPLVFLQVKKIEYLKNGNYGQNSFSIIL